jgi:hypothetical protein
MSKLLNSLKIFVTMGVFLALAPFAFAYGLIRHFSPLKGIHALCDSVTKGIPRVDIGGPATLRRVSTGLAGTLSVCACVSVGALLGYVGTPWLVMYAIVWVCGTMALFSGLNRIDAHQRTKCEQDSHYGTITDMSDWVGHQPTPTDSDFSASVTPTEDIVWDKRTN